MYFCDCMYLRKITLQNFKNIRDAHLEFSPRINCVSGSNGEGKTNLLDAVYYLSMTKSYFRAPEQFSCTMGESQMVINGEYVRNDGTEAMVAVQLAGEQKTFKSDHKVCSKLSEHIGRFPIVMISPSDTSLINDSAEARRRFMNMLLSQTDREYLRAVQSYNKLLQYRNKLLKEENVNAELVDTISFKMSPFAQYVYEKRTELIEDLTATAKEYYRMMSDGKEEISMLYRSDLQKNNMYDLLTGSLHRDMLLRYTGCGVQRDEIEFMMNGYPIREYGSQGQQKTFLLALKLAQFDIMRRWYGSAPILLLDDVFDKLDASRVEFLLKLVSGDDFGQIFITDCNSVRLENIIGRMNVPSLMIGVTAGVFSVEMVSKASEAGE